MTHILTRILLHTVLLALGFAIIAAGLSQFRLIALSGYAVYASLLLPALMIAGLFNASKLTRFSDELIDIDRRLGLHEQLSTAYEYARSGRHSEIGDVLLEQSCRLLASLDRQQIYPRRFSRKHALIPLLTLVLFVLLTGDFLPFLSEHGPVTQERLQQLGEELQELTSDTAASEQDSQKELAQHTKKLAESLQKGEHEQHTLVSEMETLLENARSQRKQLTDMLESKLMDRPLSELPAINPTEKAEELTSEQLSQLMEQIETMLEQFDSQESRRQGTIPQKLASLSRNLQLEHVLQESLDDMNGRERGETDSSPRENGMSVYEPGTGEGDGGESGAGDEDSTASEGQQGTFSEDLSRPGTEALPSDTQMMLEELANMVRSPQSQPGSGRSDLSQEDPMTQGGGLSAQPDEKQGTGGSDAPGSDDDGEFSSLAGKEEGQYHPQDIEKLRSSQRSAIQDNISDSPAEEYRKIVRSLATLGRSEVKAEDVMISYEQEVEAILHKEDIPAIYREYIRNYFISIGVKNE